MNMQQLRTFALAISVASILFSSFGSTALGEEQGSQVAPILEPIEWTDIWVTNANRDALPRVLKEPYALML